MYESSLVSTILSVSYMKSGKTFNLKSQENKFVSGMSETIA